MVEAIAHSGYERTSVKQVIGLAGVSRRSFYEQFTNKEQCFLAAFDVLAGRDIQRITKACAASSGSLDKRLRAAYRALVESAKENPKASTLVLVESQTAGMGGALRLRRALASCEQMLAHGFAESSEAVALPAPIVRGIVGGLHGAMSTVLCEVEIEDRPGLAEDMLRWTLLFQAPAAADLSERMGPRMAQHMREISVASARRDDPERSAHGDTRERLLHNALRLAGLHDFGDLTAPQIADEARVSIDDFLELFPDRDTCYLAALDMVSDEILTLVADPELIDDDWAHAVRRVVSQLMSYLSEHPLYTRTIVQEAYFAGSEAVSQILELTMAIATLLTEGAPTKPRSGIAVEGIAGAFMHTVRSQVASGRIQLLPALSDYFSYIVLAPYIGAERASEIVTEEPGR
jgi:AcrR family transcriptional regulator